MTGLFICYSCKDEIKECDKKNPNSLNPNGDSELAKLMREMVNHAQSAKDSLNKNAELPAYPNAFSKIFFVKKTDSTINKQMFDGLAQVYLNNIQYLYKVKPEDRKVAYNSLVESCSGCHKNFCGGPLKRINKLYLK
ncbi:MAG: hypothetical protein ACK452_03575 [Bacteroidota bacterium]